MRASLALALVSGLGSGLFVTSMQGALDPLPLAEYSYYDQEPTSIAYAEPCPVSAPRDPVPDCIAKAGQTYLEARMGSLQGLPR